MTAEAAPKEASSPPPRGGAGRALGCLVVLAALAGGTGWAVRQRLAARAETLARAQPEPGARKVVAVKAEEAKGQSELVLPGTIEAAGATPLLSRASGVIRERKVDIGAKVKKGDVLAVVDAAEMLDQLRAAEARAEQARAALPIAERNQARTSKLVAEGAATQQQADDALDRVTASKGALDAATAEVARLRTLVGYQRVVAPFDGTITARSVDVGTSVTAGVTQLFQLTATEDLVVVVFVPQWLAERIAVGSKAIVASRTGGPKPVDVTVTRTSGVLDPATRTLRVELHLPAAAGWLAGAYANVKFAEARRAGTVVVPASTLSFGAKGSRVAVVVDGKVAWRPIEIRRDLGKDLELSAGVKPGEQVLLYPPADLAEGEVVEVRAR